MSSHLFDHANGDTPSTTPGYAQRLNGSANEKFGLAKSISVMPGDKINTEVYAKYVDTNSSNWTAALTTLLSQIAAGTAPAGTVVDGGGYSTSTSSFPFPIEAAANTSGSSETGPKAYLNWLVFDRDYNLLVGQCGYDRLSGVLKEQGQDVTHERLFSPEITITEPGYVYIYLSNEETAPVEVYFDDLRVEHIKSPIVSTSDYYAFGMQFNNFEKENSAEQKYLYNLKELQDELNLEWYDYGARMYYPAIARWMAVDPLADQYRRWSPYNYAVDNPVKFIDPDGMGVNDIYALDNMTGAIEFVEEQEGDDVLIDKQTNDVIDGSVERGILKDGMNIEKDGLQTSKVGEGTNLVVNISMHVGKEVTGTVYENSEGEQMLNVMSYDKAETYRDKDDRRIVTGMGTGYSSEIIQGL